MVKTYEATNTTVYGEVGEIYPVNTSEASQVMYLKGTHRESHRCIISPLRVAVTVEGRTYHPKDFVKRGPYDELTMYDYWFNYIYRFFDAPATVVVVKSGSWYCVEVKVGPCRHTTHCLHCYAMARHANPALIYSMPLRVYNHSG